MTDQAIARARLRRYATRTAIPLVLVVVVLVGTAFAAAAILRVPPPPTLIHLFVDAPSAQGALFASRTVPASPIPRLFPRAPASLPNIVPWKGSQVPVAEFLGITRANSFLVLRHGTLTHEWYRDGIASTTRQSSWSVAKSVVSLLAGPAIDAGQLREDDYLVDILPELSTGGDYDKITVRNLLDMTSGVEVSENYNRYLPLTGTVRMYLTEDLAGFVHAHRELRFAPGSTGEYRSVDTQLLGMVVARVTGTPLAELLAQQIWRPIGAQDGALWNLDRQGGQEKAFCCLNATARDFAKIGQLVLDDGRVNDTQVVLPAWIARIRRPAPLPVNGWGYGAYWWHPSGMGEQDLTAIGVYGQYIYLDPPSGTVIVKLSDYGTTQDAADTIDVFRAIARSR